MTAVESLADLSARAGRDLSGLDPHRPFVDEVAFACPDCGQEARRVPDVLDAWFDSGSMPFAQWGYPHAPEGRAAFERAFPADFISEGIDQTRGWFYSLLAVSTLLFDQTSYRNVVCLGLIVDREGRKMSKSLGNALDPFELLDRYGADPLRWFMLASGSPWVSRRLFPQAIEDVTRSFFLTLWNTYSFFSLYARLEGFDPTRPAAGAAPPRWTAGSWPSWPTPSSRSPGAWTTTTPPAPPGGWPPSSTTCPTGTCGCRGGASGAAPAPTPTPPSGPSGPACARWRCCWPRTRRSRPRSCGRGWWCRSTRRRRTRSTWPTGRSRPGRRRPRAGRGHGRGRRLVGLGRQARTEAKLKVRQPLARALISVPDPVRAGVAGLLDLVAAELNVKEVGFAEGDTGLVAYRLAPNFRALGPRFGRDAQAVAAALRQVPAELAAELAPRLRAGQRVELEVEGLGRVELGPEEAGVVEEPATGWRVVRDGPTAVALDLEVTPELRREGLARDLVRAVQDLRKAAGLEVADRIELAVKADGEAGRGRGRRPPRLPARRDPRHQPAHRPPGRRPRHPGRPGRPGGPHLAAPGARRGGSGGDRGRDDRPGSGVARPVRVDDLGDLLPAARSLWGYVWAAPNSLVGLLGG